MPFPARTISTECKEGRKRWRAAQIAKDFDALLPLIPVENQQAAVTIVRAMLTKAYQRGWHAHDRV